MNRPNDTHFHKRRVLQLAEALLKQELRQYVAAREEWLQPWANAAMLAAMRRLQLSLSPNLAGHFFDAAQIKAPWEHALVPSGTRGRRAQPKPAPTTRRQRHEPPAPVLWPCHLRRKGVAAWARQVRGDRHACGRPDKLTTAKSMDPDADGLCSPNNLSLIHI